MIFGGLPLDMQQAINLFNVETGFDCNILIGINTGSVVARVIGIKSLSTIYKVTPLILPVAWNHTASPVIFK